MVIFLILVSCLILGDMFLFLCIMEWLSSLPMSSLITILVLVLIGRPYISIIIFALTVMLKLLLVITFLIHLFLRGFLLVECWLLLHLWLLLFALLHLLFFFIIYLRCLGWLLILGSWIRVHVSALHVWTVVRVRWSGWLKMCLIYTSATCSCLSSGWCSLGLNWWLRLFWVTWSLRFTVFNSLSFGHYFSSITVIILLKIKSYLLV